MMYGWGFGWMTIVWLVAFGAVAWLVGGNAWSTRRSAPTDAQAILDERYARGDISHDEYTNKRATIEELKR